MYWLNRECMSMWRICWLRHCKRLMWNCWGCRMIKNKVMSILFLVTMLIKLRILRTIKTQIITYWHYFLTIHNLITNYCLIFIWLWVAFLPTKISFLLHLKFLYLVFKFQQYKSQLLTMPNHWWLDCHKLANFKSMKYLGCWCQM